jgi:hypothetical protein
LRSKTANFLSLTGTLPSPTETFRFPTVKSVYSECDVEVPDSNIAVADRKILLSDQHGCIPNMQR